MTGNTIRRWVAVLATAFVLATAVVVGMPAPAAQAADGSAFNAGYIISDQKFYDSSAMTEKQIQAFLDSKVADCKATKSGPTCLKNYKARTYTRPAVAAGHCYAYTSEGTETAARIILKVAKACNINPQVLLATLQKEQGLVTSTKPSERQYRVAMGYGCPDTAPCDAQFYGFYNQVYKAAWQFRQYTYSPKTWRYRIGNVAVQYHPNAACGAPVVKIVNQATANLYNYTPYQPNAAALANLGGVGNSCSSYGNRNFWKYFTDWFGSTTGAINPLGSLDVAQAAPDGIRVAGWALDPDTKDSTYVHVYVDGVGTAVRANTKRSDIAALYPSKGAAHGFDAVVPVTQLGAHKVCVYAINVGPGAHTTLKCTTVTTLGASPVGTLETAKAGSGKIAVSGWALDRDTTKPISVQVYVGSTLASTVTAKAGRSDIGAKYPAWGSSHGFSATVPAAAGTQKVCAYAVNVGDGATRLLNCLDATVAGTMADTGRTPIGSLDVVSASTAGISVGGWVIDPDTAASSPVHIYVNNVGTAITADLARPDVGAVYPAYGAAHGFSKLIPAKAGTYTVCVYGINTGPGAHLGFGCRTVTVPGAIPELGRTPFGSFDVATASNKGIAVGGWAIDPDTASPIAVHVFVDGVGTVLGSRDERSDIAAIYPAYGGAHGFSGTVSAGKGTHTVCVYAINTAAGGHTSLGCRTVTR